MEATVEFETDEPMELTVRRPAVVSSPAHEEEAWSKQRLGVGAQLRIDEQPREERVDVQLCLPGVAEFLDRHGWELDVEPERLAREMSSSGDGCPLHRYDPRAPEAVSAVEITARREEGCAKPGAHRSPRRIEVDMSVRRCPG